MILFLDFDRTLFHTEAYKKEVGLEGMIFRNAPERYWEALSKTKDLSPHLFKDVRDFLNNYKHCRCVLLTYGDKEYQKLKVTQSGVIHLFEDTIFTGDEMKGEIIKRMFPDAREKMIFLDDAVEQLEDMKKHCPHVVSVQMLRSELIHDNKTASDDFPKVSSLEEFAQLLPSF